MTAQSIAEGARRVLIVDDVVPNAAAGSGYPRMLETISTIQAVPNVEVSLFPVVDVFHAGTRPVSVRRWTGELPLEVITEELGRHLRRVVLAGRAYDLVIISRPHNYQLVIKTIKRYLRDVPVIYDAEALFYRRLERQLDLAESSGRRSLRREMEAMREVEETIAREVDELVCVSQDEAEILRQLTDRPGLVHSPLLHSMDWTEAGFQDRSGVCFIAGWSAGAKSPNGDGMRWFAREVWPRVLARLPEAELEVTGAKAPIEVRRFACESIRFIGRVDDLKGYYGSRRVVIVPNRYGAGVKNKTMEALQAGVPVVSTVVGAEGMPIPGFTDGSAGRPAWSPSYLFVTDDPTEFAVRIVALLRDEQLWEQERQLLRAQCSAWERERLTNVWPSILERYLPSSYHSGDLSDSRNG